MKNKTYLIASIIAKGVQIGLTSETIIFYLRVANLSYRKQDMLYHIRKARELYKILNKKS